MTDKELLELAAKAAGVKHTKGDYEAGLDTPEGFWNPLTDDGDALRLAVKLRLELGFPDHNFVWSFGRDGAVCKEDYNNDPYAATRRAIVRAAAEIGRGME